VLAAAAGTAAFVALYVQARAFAARGEAIPLPVVAGFGGVLLVLLAAFLAGSTRKPSGRLIAGISAMATELRSPDAARRRLSPLDLIVPLLVAALVYVVDWRALSGRFFLEESFIHWDYFAMGPTLSFRHGAALGEVHSTYGVGWPMFFGALSHVIPISLGRLIQVGSIYACIYFVAIYLLLRLLVRPVAAALGTLVMVLQLFLAMGDISLWRIPSLSVLRWPFDVWCFIALAMHFKTGKRSWAVAAGVSIGLAIVFVLDTGLYLAAAFAFYGLCTLGLAESRFRKGWFLPSVVAGVLAVFLGLGVASRWTLFGLEFWKRWIETIFEFTGGFGMLPLATTSNLPTLVFFVMVFLAGLSLMAYGLIKALYRRSTHLDAFLGFLGFYQLLALLHFIGRSGDYTPFRLWIPVGIAFVVLADRLYGAFFALTAARPGRSLVRRAVKASPYLAVAAGVAFLMLAPAKLVAEAWVRYPNLVNAATRPRLPSELCLISQPKDICGLPEKLRPTVGEFQRIVDRLAQIKAEGKEFAAIEETGALFYLATDTRPWGRYSRTFVSLRSKDQLAEATQSLKANPVDYVLTRAPGEQDSTYELWPLYSFGYGLRPDSLIADSWAAFAEIVQKDYALETRIGPFEIRRYSPRAPR
jgi:hypothetical protein